MSTRAEYSAIAEIQLRMTEIGVDLVQGRRVERQVPLGEIGRRRIGVTA